MFSLPTPWFFYTPLKSNFGPQNGILFATIVAVSTNHDICILRFRGLYKPWHMFVCHGFCEPWREFTENLTRGYKKRSEGEKKKGSYSIHIFNISAIHRQFFFLQMLHRHFFFVVEIASKLTCGLNCTLYLLNCNFWNLINFVLFLCEWLFFNTFSPNAFITDKHPTT